MRMLRTFGVMTVTTALLLSLYVVFYSNILARVDKVLYKHLPNTAVSTPDNKHNELNAINQYNHNTIQDDTEHAEYNSNTITYTRMCPIKHSTATASDYYYNRLWMPHIHQWLIISDIELQHHQPSVGAGHFIDITTWAIADNIHNKTLDRNQSIVDILSQYAYVHIYGDLNSSSHVTVQCSIYTENDYPNIMQHVPHIIRCALPTRMRQPAAVELQFADDAYIDVEQQFIGRRQWTDIAEFDDNLVTWPIDTNQRTVKIQLCQQTVPAVKYALCAAPVDDPITANMIKQWIDYHLYIGIDTVYVYTRQYNDYNSVLQPYIDTGRVNAIYFPIPDTDNKQKNLYLDQSVSSRHCYSTARYSADWLLYIDIDEYLVPYQQTIKPATCHTDNNNNVFCDSMLESQMNLLHLSDLHLQSQFGYENRVGAIQLPAVEYIVAQYNNSNLWLINQFPQRKPFVTGGRTKLLSRPQWLLSGWIHSVHTHHEYTQIATMSNLWDQDLTVEQQEQVPIDQAMRIHHYVSLIVNRDEAFLAGKEITRGADKDALIHDDTFIQRITAEIDRYKQKHTWPVKLETL